MRRRREELTDKDKAEIFNRRPQCFICERPLGNDPSASVVVYDHIKSLARGGTNALTNFAALHRGCNAKKGTKDVEEHKEQLRLERELSAYPRYSDVAQKLGAGRRPLDFVVEESQSKITFGDGTTVPLHKCPATGLLFFYHAVPREWVESDVDVQPRGLENQRLLSLTMSLRHSFQLSPSVARLITEERKIKMFDGQHKAAAQTLGNQRERIDCKVFIDPPLEMVRDVVVEGHGKLRQQSFKPSELCQKLRATWVAASDKWQKDHPGAMPSEKGLANYEGLSPAQARLHIEAVIVESILEHPGCEMKRFISRERRTGEMPLTYAMFKRWVCSVINRPPLDVPMESDEDLRENERENIVRLCNIIVRESLADKWNPQNPEDEEHRKARALYYRESFRAWTHLVHEAIRWIVRVRADQPLFYRQLKEEQWESVETACKRVFDHALWVDPDPNVPAVLSANLARDVQRLFDDKELNLVCLTEP